MTQSTCSSPLPPASRACQWNFLFNPIFPDSQNLINSGSFHHPTFSLRSLATRILTTFLFAYLHFQKWETLEDLCTPLGRVLLFTIALPHCWLLMMVFTPLGFCVWFLQPRTYCLSLVPLLWLPKTFKYSLYITSLVFKLDRVPCYTVLWYPYLFFIALIIIMAIITSFIQWLPLPGIGIGSVLFIASPTPRTWHVIDTYYIFAKWMDEWSQPNMSSHTFIPKLFSMITNDLLVAKSTGYFLISISTQ